MHLVQDLQDLQERPATDVALTGIDLFSPEGFRSGNQHPVWQHLRETAPVWWHEVPGQHGFWCVTRYADCERVLKDHRTFSSEHGSILASVGVGDPAGGRTLSLMDPPRHTGLRSRTMRTFSHSVVRAKAEGIRARIRRLVDTCCDGQVDFARTMSLLPMIVSGELLGIPEEYWQDITWWVNTSLAPEDPEYAAGRPVAQSLALAHHELFSRFAEVIGHRRRHPGTDLISLLLGWEDGQRRLDDRTVALNCYSFILGANSTTPHVASHTLAALIDRPEIWETVAARPDLVPALVEEGVRWSSPTHHLVRRATADTTIGDVALAQGDWVAVWTASANRDESVFTDPYAFDIRRSPNPHIGFGAGPHYCIGAPLARMALGSLFEELIRRLGSVEPAGPVAHLSSNWINGIVSMPITTKAR
ncbi:cytochrome P450 [Streptomyces sp. NPDC086077]|uniref:cytochrome P450 n=1 Tax=Streptomyces sp. NPDC086077 TaxID=3154862 RepID=UPI00342642D9